MLLLGGCATTTQGAPDERDPLEPYNRAMFRFNDAVDRAVVKPVAKGYKAVTPEFVDEGITNFFANLEDLTVAANSLLQGKFHNALSDASRVVVNSTVGVLGFFDVASALGAKKHDEDFGQTLGYWGVPPGPYLVLPLLGPSTVRDAPALAVDLYTTDVVFLHEDETVRNVGLTLEFVDTRADLLSKEEIVEDIAFDRYDSIRNAYLEHRRFLVHDGEPPPREGEVDLIEELEQMESLPDGGDSSSSP